MLPLLSGTIGLTLGLLVSVTPAGIDDRIDLESLLEELLDRSAIAEFPVPAFVCEQASSYDRRAKEPGNADWFANSDSSHYLRCEEKDGRREWVMLDVDGPGAIVRWWTTQYRYGSTIRIYLDGAEEPVFAGTNDELIGGTTLTGPPLSAVTAWARNLYLPIPFAKHLKITYDGPNRVETGEFADCHYYAINYLRYAEGTGVETLTPERLRASAEAIAHVQATLRRPDEHALEVSRTIEGAPWVLAPGKSLLQSIAGPGAIASLRVRVRAEDIEQALRSTVIAIDFDGEPCVWAPVGEFFGSGPGLNPFQGWWRRVDEDGWMTCWWPMPFKDNARIALTNHGTDDVTVELGPIGVADWTWTDRTMYFHATWRGDHRIEVFGGDFTRAEEWNYLTASGRGVYVGDTLSLFNRPIEGPIGPWWGEGDEKIFVDGESFPSHFGTGTEDYFGYAWGVGDLYSAPFHAQPVADGNGGIGPTTNTRTRSLDRIPFEKSLRFDMELSHWQPSKLDYATTSYWYACAGATGNGEVAPEKVRRSVRDLPAELTRHDYRGWNAYRLKNQLVDLHVVPEIGGRVIQLALGAKELFWVNPELAGRAPTESGLTEDGGWLTEDGSWLNYGGEKLWPVPQGWEGEHQWPGPPDAVLDGGSHEVEVLPTEDDSVALRLSSRDDPRCGIRLSRVLRLHPGSTRVSVEATMTNVDTRSRRWGIQEHTQLDGAAPEGEGHNARLRAWCPINPKSDFEGGYSVIFGEKDNPTFQPDHERGLMGVHYLYLVGKIGLDSDAGWVATVEGASGTVFVQRFVFDAELEYPDGASVEFWTNGRGKIHAYGEELVMGESPPENPYVFESELLSPFYSLEPGESATWHYDWYTTRVGGDLPIVDCTPSGVTAEPLDARTVDGRVELRGRFGVFAPGELEVGWFDADGSELSRTALPKRVTPLAPTPVAQALEAPAGAVSVRLFLVRSAELDGELARATIR